MSQDVTYYLVELSAQGCFSMRFFAEEGTCGIVAAPKIAFPSASIREYGGVFTSACSTDGAPFIRPGLMTEGST
jgi:hypothetical protein